jgi:YVTN family beta-propeller protein
MDRGGGQGMRARQERGSWVRRLGVALTLLALALGAVLAGCGSDSAGVLPTQGGTPPPTLALPPQLAGAHVFTTDLATGDLAALGTRTYHIARSVHGLGLSRDGRWLYVSDIASNRLLALPLVGGTLGDLAQAHAVLVGSQPVHMVNVGNRIFVANFGFSGGGNTGGMISVVNTQTWTVEKTLATPAQPHSIVLSPAGDIAYAGCYGGAAITVIDTASATVVRTIALPQAAEPYGLAISPDGRYVYATDNLTGRLFVADVRDPTGRAVPTVTVGQHPALIARSPDGQTLYIASGSSGSVTIVSIADPAHPRVRATVAVGGYPHGLAVTPDGNHVVVATTTGKTLTVIDTRTNAVVATVAAEQYPNDVLIAG